MCRLAVSIQIEVFLLVVAGRHSSSKCRVLLYDVLEGDRVRAVAECVQSAALHLALRLFDRARGRPELPVVEVDSFCLPQPPRIIFPMSSQVIRCTKQQT